MRQFIKRALQKLNKLTSGQAGELLISAADEIDRLETVLDSLTDGILVCGINHTLIKANRYAGRYLPINIDDINDEPIWERIRDEKVAAFLETILLMGDRIEDKEFYVENMEKQRLLSLSVLPLVHNGSVSGSLILIEDITEKRNREARMRRMENLASLTTLAAGVAHEIKNPLGSLSIHVQLIQKSLAARKDCFGDQFNAFEKYLNVMNEEIDRLNHIVVDFLFAVRPMEMDMRQGNINALLRELVEFVFFELEENHIECVLELKEDLPAVLFDERHMKQAILNLVKNAIAAMPDGGILSIKTEVADADAVITVADTGQGVPEENLSKIFEPYFTTKPSGSGLGLTLVYKIIREHQGEVSVKSKPGEGACFTISLPIPQKERRLIGFF
jgi:PAS domain S-box-containing protein